ncbi:MAG: hypothetical protein U0457_18030 [Candidatus Sericytochromatia bacterium]
MAIQSIQNKNIVSSYINPKTKASEKFLQLLSNKDSLSLDKPLQILDLDDKDEFIKEDKEITANNKESFEKNNEVFFPEKQLEVPDDNIDFPTHANKFTNQVNSFTDIEAKPNSLESKFIKPTELKLMSLKKAINTSLEKITTSSNILDMLKFNVDNILTEHSNPSSLKADEVIKDALDNTIDEIVNDLIRKADLSFELLDLSFDNYEIANAEISFLQKLREIIVNLDKGLREIQKKVEQKNKDSEVKIQIKRFDTKDLKKYVKL